MKRIQYLAFLFAFVIFFSCGSDDEGMDPISDPDPDPKEEIDPDNEDFEIDDFIYENMNLYYLYKEDVADLANNRWESEQKYKQYLANFESPESLFDNLLSKDLLLGQRKDRFSFLINDINTFKNAQSGVITTSGMQFKVGLIFQDSRDLFGYVTYVLPNTDAATKGIQRGQFFTHVDGLKLTIDNFLDLLINDNASFTIGFADQDFQRTEDITLLKAQHIEDPIHIAKTLEFNGKRVGYLMYNEFNFDFNGQLNEVFADFKAEGISDLVLDLRYNGGGSVNTAIALAGMITGQFKGEIFTQNSHNKDYQAAINNFANADEILFDRFSDKVTIEIKDDGPNITEPMNSLNLNRVIVLAGSNSASASELIINSLEPYIEVVHIGNNTTGKFQGSATIYDSERVFTRQGINPNHNYALQPLIVKIANKEGITDFANGLTPDYTFIENAFKMGTLGDVFEPWLNEALEYIVTGTLTETKNNGNSFKEVGNSKMKQLNYQRMYVDMVPEK
ncbi:S41 family peptidase [Aquimarina sp. ERC-38]|uniref:S41 family peptidase n=1 Tax=Aquimarina sp. ERC-38 TaxID=2949996 RepID=UPI0022462E3E|nr:S41 family peptidase [Aquimarina sp. ERC-38]UZO80771.1 S41 family peptidase [Aquimarina sp. ERC-38]